MSTLFGRKIAMSAGLLAVLAGLNITVADVNKALDRVPGNAALVAAVKDMAGVQAKFENFLTSMGAPMDEENPAAQLKQLLSTPGVDSKGSLAMAIMPDAEGGLDFESDPHFVVLVPVTDYQAFIKGMGGEAGGDITAITINGEEGFVKNLGDGYVVMSPMSETLESFTPGKGQAEAHRKSWGKVGRAAAEKADAVFVMNIPMFKDKIEEGLGGLREQMDMFAQMGMGGGNEAQMAMGMEIIETLGTTFANDGQTGLIAARLGETGIHLDITAQFEDGSEVAGFFAKTGSSSSLLSNIPNQPFLMAMAFDSSVPGIKTVLRNLGQIAQKHQGDAPNPMGIDMSMLKSIDAIDGQATIIGGNPAAMMGGGLLANTSSFVKTSDPKGYVAALKKQTTAADGMQQQGMTFRSSYTDNAVEVNGVKADTWSMRMEMDPNDPNAFQVQMAMGMIFGQGGMGGMVAPLDNGVIVTMSQNTPLLTSAIEAAKNGGGLASNDLLKKSQAQLPSARTFEMYLGSKTILDSVGGILAMMGGGAEFNVPAQLTPIGFAGTTDGGGAGVHIYVPSDVIKAVADIAKSMDQGGDDWEMDDEEAGAPEF